MTTTGRGRLCCHCWSLFTHHPLFWSLASTLHHHDDNISTLNTLMRHITRRTRNMLRLLSVEYLPNFSYISDWMWFRPKTPVTKFYFSLRQYSYFLSMNIKITIFLNKTKKYLITNLFLASKAGTTLVRERRVHKIIHRWNNNATTRNISTALNRNTVTWLDQRMLLSLQGQRSGPAHYPEAPDECLFSAD